MIIICPKGSLDKHAKERISKSGNIWIESDEPEKFRLIEQQSQFKEYDFFMAALAGCDCNLPVNKAEIFVHTLRKRLLAEEQKQNP